MAQTNVQTQQQTGLDLSVLAEYQKITKVESELKKRKEEIKKQVKTYLNLNGLTETEPHEDLIGALEERTSYGLDEVIMEAGLPAEVFDEIVEKKVNPEKAKAQFLAGNIPLNLILAAETTNTKESFYVRKADREVKENKTMPFWRV